MNKPDSYSNKSGFFEVYEEFKFEIKQASDFYTNLRVFFC